MTGDAVGSESGIVGRFTPSRLEVTANTPRFQTACALGAFTWIGQPFDFVSGEEPVLTVRAVNIASQTTGNYFGDWWRVTNDSLDNRDYSMSGGTLDQTGLPASTVDPAIVSSGDGTGTLSFSAGSGLIAARSNPVAPFYGEIALSIDVIDEDGVAFLGNPVTIGGTSSGAGIAFDATKRFQFGRVSLDNAHGSELVDLSMALRAQRFDGTTFVDDTNDSCSRIPASALSLTQSPSGLGSSAAVAHDPPTIHSRAAKRGCVLRLRAAPARSTSSSISALRAQTCPGSATTGPRTATSTGSSTMTRSGAPPSASGKDATR